MFLALIGAAGIAGYRIVSNLLESSKASGRKGAERVRRATAPARDLGNLEWDKDAEVYRPSLKQDH
jgi:hypothetical protein